LESLLLTLFARLTLDRKTISKPRGILAMKPSEISSPSLQPASLFEEESGNSEILKE